MMKSWEAMNLLPVAWTLGRRALKGLGPPMAATAARKRRREDRIWEKRKTKKVVADSPGFEPGTEAPEASVLSRLYYESS